MISTILATKTTGNSQRRYRPHAWTVTTLRWQRLPTEYFRLRPTRCTLF